MTDSIFIYLPLIKIIETVAWFSFPGSDSFEKKITTEAFSTQSATEVDSVKLHVLRVSYGFNNFKLSHYPFPCNHHL
jgi:hypothetical protein